MNTEIKKTKDELTRNVANRVVFLHTIKFEHAREVNLFSPDVSNRLRKCFTCDCPMRRNRTSCFIVATVRAQLTTIATFRGVSFFYASAKTTLVNGRKGKRVEGRL